MTNPFAPPPGGFGFAPLDRRALHEHRRQARRQMREHLRDQFRNADAGAGFPGPFGGFGPGRGGLGVGFDPRTFVFGPGGSGPGARRGGRGRGRRGDVRAAILKLLAERPMHGYEMIQEIAERSQNLWRPSPGSVYPTLQLLVDEGLIAATETDGSKKLFELTDDGRAAVEKIQTPPWEEIADSVQPGHANLHGAVTQLMGAVAQAAFTTGEEQQQRIVDIVNNARREIYGILGESE